MTATSVLGNSCGDIRLVAGSSDVKSEYFWSEQVVYERYEKSVAFYGDFYLRISKHSVNISWSSLTISLGGDQCNWREWVLWLTSLLLAVKSYLWLTQSATSRADVLLLCLDVRAAWEAAVLLPLLHRVFFPLVCFTVPCSPILISWYPPSNDSAFVSHLEQIFSGEHLTQLHALQIVFLQFLRQKNDKMYFSQSFLRRSGWNATGLSLCSIVGVNLKGFKI